MTTNKEKSLSTISTPKPIQKRWRSCQVSLDDSKPAIKPSRKILRLGQDHTHLNQKLILENNKPKIESIAWNTENAPVLCKAVSREVVLKEKVSPGRKQEQQDDEKFIQKNIQYKSNGTCVEEAKEIYKTRLNLPKDVRKVIKCSENSKSDNFTNKLHSLSSERWSISTNNSQNLEKLYSPNSPFVDKNELKSDQMDNIQTSLTSNQIDKNSNIVNKSNFEKSKNISLCQTFKKSENENFNKPKNTADLFLSKNNPFRKTEFETKSLDYKETDKPKQNKGSNLCDPLDSENIQICPDLSESKLNEVCGENQSKKSRSFSANFGALTDEDLEDFVLNLKRFLQAKIIDAQYMQSELIDNLNDANAHGSDCCCQECGKVEVDESNRIIGNLCSHFGKKTDEKIPVIDTGILKNINVIATVKVVDSNCDNNNGEDKSLGEDFKEKYKDQNQQNKDSVLALTEKCEESDQQSKDSILSLKESILIKSNIEKPNFLETNSNEFKDSRYLTVPSFVRDQKLFNQSEIKSTNSSVISRGKFSEFVIPLKKETNHVLLFKNIQRKYNLKMLPGYFKGIQSKISIPNSVALCKKLDIPQGKTKTISNFIMAHFISKYYAKFFTPARSWFSSQTKKKILCNQLLSDNKIVIQSLYNIRKCEKIKQLFENGSKLEVVDAVEYFKKLFIKKGKNGMHKTDYSTSEKDPCLCHNNNDILAEKTPKSNDTTLQSLTNYQQNKNAVSFHETNLDPLPVKTSNSQPCKKEFKTPRKKKYVKTDISDKTGNSREVEDYLEQTSLFEETLIKENQPLEPIPSENISCNSMTTASECLTGNQGLKVYNFSNNIQSVEKVSPATILTPEEATISTIPKNTPILREPFEAVSSNSASFLEENLLINLSSKADNLSTFSTPQTPFEIEGSDDEQYGLVSTESCDSIVDDSSLSKMDNFAVLSQDWNILIQQNLSSDRLSTKVGAIKDYVGKFNIDSQVNTGRLSQVDSDDNFQLISSEEGKGTIFCMKKAPPKFDKATSKIKDSDDLLGIHGSGSSPADQNEDYNNSDDDDSDSVLSLYAPSSASFLDEDEANNLDDRFAENLSFKKEREAIKIEQIPTVKLPKTECMVNSGMKNTIPGLKMENVGAEILEDIKDFVLDKQLTPSNTSQQVLKKEIEESTVTIRIEDLPVPTGFCYQFVKNGQCSKFSACRFKHVIPSKEEILGFSFSEECKNGQLNRAFHLFTLLKDFNSDTLEMTGLLLRSCLSQSNSEMTFLLIPDLIHHKMLTPKIVHDIFTICASCPFKYEEKLWKLYETMMLLNLCPSLNTIIILLQMYFEMLNWSKIWQLLLNTILIEPLSAIPTTICHGALTFVLHDVSGQYLPQTVNWICLSAVDDLWNIEPCLLYHLSILFQTKGYSNAYWILHKHLQQINSFPEEIVFTEEVDESQANAEYISCLQNIQEIQNKNNWPQLSDIFIFIYESSQLHSSWFIHPIVEAFQKIDNFSMMTTVFNDFVNSLCSQLKNLVKGNSLYPISGCQKHIIRIIMDLIKFCHSNKIWAEGSQIISVFLKNELEFDLKDCLDSIPHDSVLFALDICLHSEKTLHAISLLEGIGWFCQLPNVQFIRNLYLKQWLKKILQILIEQLSTVDNLPNACRVFSLFVSIIQEETNRWHKDGKLSSFNPNDFPCINHADLMDVVNKFILHCLMNENVSSAIYAYNMIKSLLPQINPRYCNVATFRALLVAAHLSPRIPPCARELYNFCARQLETYPPQKLIQPPWTMEIVLHLTNIEMHLVIEDFLNCLCNILCNQSKTVQDLTLADFQLCMMVRNDIVAEVLPNIHYLRNVPINRMEVLQQALFVLQTYIVPPLEAKMNNCQTGLLVNPESLKQFIFAKDSQRRDPGLQFHPMPNKNLIARFRGKARFR